MGSYKRRHYLLMPFSSGFIRYSFLCRFEKVQILLLVRVPSPCIGSTLGPRTRRRAGVRDIPCQEHDTGGDHGSGGQGADMALQRGQSPAWFLPGKKESKTATGTISRGGPRRPKADNSEDP